HRHDDERIDLLSERSGNRARHEQDDDEGIREKAEQLNDSREAPDGSGLVRAVRGEAPCRLATAQSLFGNRHQPFNGWCSSLGTTTAGAQTVGVSRRRSVNGL